MLDNIRANVHEGRALFRELRPYPKYALFLGIGFDGLPILVNTNAGSRVMIRGWYDFEVIKRASRWIKPDVEIVEITKQDFYSGKGADMILALEAWLDGRKQKKIALLIDSISELEIQDADIWESFRRTAAKTNKCRLSIIVKGSLDHAPREGWVDIEQSGDSYIFNENENLQVEFYIPEDLL
jgi:hypothetical protein